jgi:hypothetical protein
VWVFVAVSAAALVVAAALLNPLCLALSPVALAVVFGYSYTKRFTPLAHAVLGLALAIAPVGAWLAVRGRFEATPLVIGGAVLFWVAGFDTIYSCQDVEFDSTSGLHSLPRASASPRAAAGARRFHVWRRRCSWPSSGWSRCTRSTSGRRRGRGRAGVRAHARARGRPVARERGVLPGERLDQRRLPRGHGRRRWLA